jgi:hypothetical protein
MNMQFLSNNKHYANNKPANMINTTYVRQYQSVKQLNVQQQAISTQQTNISPHLKKMKWGEPTWFLFHTLAHKIKDEQFQQIRIELLKLIASICANLPCPICAEHADHFIKSNPYYSIQSKQGLKDFLFKFHNEVNVRKGFEIFDYSNLDTKYNSANTINIINNFMHFFKDKSHSIRMIANDMHRGRLMTQLNSWFNANIQYFDA